MPLHPPPDAEDKLRDIRPVTDAALSHLGADELLAVLLGRVREPASGPGQAPACGPGPLPSSPSD